MTNDELSNPYHEYFQNKVINLKSQHHGNTVFSNIDVLFKKYKGPSDESRDLETFMSTINFSYKI